MEHGKTDSAHAKTILQRAEWAADAFVEFDRDRVNRIVDAVADVAFRNARKFAEQAVRETGFGVVEDKVLKNEKMARDLVAHYRDSDFCTHRVNAAEKMIEIPRPAGVILALTPSTSPVAAVYFKVLSALMTRNAIVISPHPSAAETCTEAGDLLARAATEAGAPDGAVQVLRGADVAVVQEMMADPRTKVIVATGGLPVVRAAYRSGTPALGVGPGNPPVFVDQSADLEKAAADLVASKSFDNSVLCTAESVLLVEEPIADALLQQLSRHGAHVCSPDEVNKVRDFVYPGGAFNGDVVGQTARDIAHRAGFQVPAHVKVLITPIDQLIDEEPLTHEKLCPVLGFRRVANVARGIAEARTLIRIVGTGHSAVIHSQNANTVFEYGAALSAHRITVNAPGSLGGAGIGTYLAPTMSVGTGFKGGSATGENLRPDHLVHWSRVAYGSDPSITFPDFGAVRSNPRSADLPHRIPPYPVATNADAQPEPRQSHDGLAPMDTHDAFREDLRRIVLEELRELIGSR